LLHDTTKIYGIQVTYVRETTNSAGIKKKSKYHLILSHDKAVT